MPDGNVQGILFEILLADNYIRSMYRVPTTVFRCEPRRPLGAADTV
jgi:hypothetical protein